MTVTDLTTADRHDVVPGYRLDRLARRVPALSRTYEGSDLAGNQRVLITISDPEVGASSPYVRRLQRLSRVARQVGGSPGLARVLTVGEAEGRPFIVVERPTGTPLDRALADGPIPVALAVSGLRQVAEGLDRLHRTGIVAGDLNPGAIFAVGDGESVLAAFGWGNVGWLRGRGQRVPVELLDYAAPEQLRGQPTTPRTDVFALAAVLFHAITGTPPYQDAELAGQEQSAADAMRARRGRPAPTVNAYLGEIDPRVDAIIARGLSDAPGLRPATPRHLLEQLAQVSAEPDAPIERHSGAPATRRFARAGVAPTARRVDRPQPAARRASQPPPASRRVDRPRPATRRPDRPTDRRPAAGVIVPESARSSSARSTRRRSGAAGLATVGLIGAALGTALALGVTGPGENRQAASSTPQAAGLTASRGDLRIQYPASWERTRPQKLPRMPLRDAMAFRPRTSAASDSGDARLLVGMVADTDINLLPPALSRRMAPASRSAAEPVRLGRHVGLRHADVAQWGQGGPWTLYTVPTTAGTATVICEVSILVPSLIDTCEGMASTLVPTRGRTLTPGPDATFARRVSAVARDLDVRRRLGRARLRSVRSNSGQARMLGHLVRAYAVAAQELDRAPKRPGTAVLRRELLDSVRTTRAGYEQLARAANKRDRGAYNRAVDAIGQRESALRRALDRIRAWASGAPAPRTAGS